MTKGVEDTPFDARSVNDRNATTLFLTELFRGILCSVSEIEESVIYIVVVW